LSKVSTGNGNPAVRRELEDSGLGAEQLRGLYRNMLLQRQIDTRGFQLNRQGKIPFALGSEGHEAVQAGAAAALSTGRDALALYYRDLGLALGAGVPPLDLLLAMFARTTDSNGGRQFPNHYTNRKLGILSISSVIAAQCPHAVGVALAFVFRKEADRAVLCSFGDGATSEGEWHESLNFAAVRKLPVVFLCQNNGLAISTPREKQMAVEHVWQRAAGYGIPGVPVDGSDPVACYLAVREAFARARAGEGPTLIDARIFRFLSHSSDDDDRTYRSRDVVAAHRKDDPVPKFEKRLIAAGLLTPAEAANLKRETLRITNEATDAAEAAPPPAAQDVYAGVYEGPWQPWQ
jgi:2-oxoisovalerate dehydrogenase E1 component alpha subunit